MYQIGGNYATNIFELSQMHVQHTYLYGHKCIAMVLTGDIYLKKTKQFCFWKRIKGFAGDGGQQLYGIV